MKKKSCLFQQCTRDVGTTNGIHNSLSNRGIKKRWRPYAIVLVQQKSSMIQIVVFCRSYNRKSTIPQVWLNDVINVCICVNIHTLPLIFRIMFMSVFSRYGAGGSALLFEVKSVYFWPVGHCQNHCNRNLLQVYVFSNGLLNDHLQKAI